VLDYRARTLQVNDATYAAWNAHGPSLDEGRAAQPRGDEIN